MVSNDDTIRASFQIGAANGAPPQDAIVELGKVVSNAQSIEMSVTRLAGALVGCDLACTAILPNSSSVTATALATT